MNALTTTLTSGPLAAPGPALPFRAVLESEFERLKRRLLLSALWEEPGTETGTPIRRAANEAAAAAWASGFPLLTFPLLFEELARRYRSPAAASPAPSRAREESEFTA
jgi:hypothetical protein